MSFLDTPEIKERIKLIDEVIKDIEHLDHYHQLSILFSWIDIDALKMMHGTICKERLYEDYDDNRY